MFVMNGGDKSGLMEADQKNDGSDRDGAAEFKDGKERFDKREEGVWLFT